jgi:hypothetical protein
MSAFIRIFITVVLICAASLLRITSLAQAESPLSDADEVRVGKILADSEVGNAVSKSL